MKNFNLHNREKRIFFIYKFFLLKLTSEEVLKELHENLFEFDFSVDQQNTILEIIKQRDYLEKIITDNLLNWSWDRIGFLEKSILINAVGEILLLKNKKTIVIDESIIFAKKYCGLDTYKYINGVLDKIN